MDGTTLSLSNLKDKITSKLSGSHKDTSKAFKKSSKNDNGLKKDAKKASTASHTKENSKKGSKDFKKDTKKDTKKGKYSKESSVSKKGESSIEDDLKREALALGATEEDLELLNGLDDDESETEFGDSSNDKTLASDISKFMTGLGFLGEVEVVSEEEEQEEEEEEEEEEIEQDEEHQEEDEEHEDEEDDENNGTTEAVQVQIASLKSKPVVVDKFADIKSVNSTKLKIENRIDWYNIETTPIENPEKLDRFALERITERAKAIVDQENKTYLEEFASDNSQRKFLSQILADGTLNDKISALTLLVQEAPLHNMKAFETLLYYCEKKSRTAALQAIDAMKDLLLNGLLPDRKLVSLFKQPLSKDASDEKVALAYYEDYLKKSYFKFIQILEHLSHDPILHVRMNVVSHIFDLLKAKPEQEANLLRLGVNKLGDVENKVAAKTSYQILQLEQAHPAMKKIITDAVTDMVLQKSNDYHAQYFTILTLNQTILTRTEHDLANALVKTYFSLFEKILYESDPARKEGKEDKVLGTHEQGRKNNRKAFKKGKKGGRSVKVAEKSEEEVIEEKSAKMFSALLTGLNRAFPFADLPSDIYMKHLDTLYKITHSTNFNTSVQALVLVQHIVSQQDLDADRFYRTLYESLLDPRLVSSSKQGIYLNLLFKSLKNDIQNVPRVLAFVHRILQICAHWINIGAIAGMFYLLMELSKTFPQILELMEPKEARPDFSTADGAEANADPAKKEYDSRKRNPEYANAENSCLWEISQFLNHYHPTVAIYAQSLLDGEVQPKPDLGLFSLAHFLDRFVYKNVKQKSTTKGSSIMQPLGGAHTGSLLVRATNTSSKQVPVNTVDWLSKKASDIRPDEQFFYQYFAGNTRKIRSQKADEGEEDSDAEPLDDEDVWDALVKLKPDVEGLSDEDGFSDMDEADFSDFSEDDDVIAGAENNGDVPDFDDEELEDGQMFDMNESDEFGSDEEPQMLEESDVEDASSDSDAGKKRSRKDDDKKSKKQKLLSLPVFASAEDYSEYLNSDDE
ncbi:CIC11C00000001171 [Sungouiella intermedia]|uniref:CIC11C00000001171 n=1 Tax=Sungouiella intermedia TaxID=45354 RepID=A0A1L0FU97_9ASCO|nr:CIC11C00000001171 [[Candida] intermedia]